MTTFAERPSAERELFIEEAAARLNIAPDIVEKDYWVCWALDRIFSMPEHSDGLVFKGGTSLSKVFGVIRRFSEDVDLSVSPERLGFKTADIESIAGRTKRDKKFDEVQKACALYATVDFRLDLEQKIETVLGRPSKGKWVESSTGLKGNAPELIFSYPTVVKREAGYIRRSIKLELGSLTDQKPRGSHVVTPLLSEALPNVGTETVRVVALEVERTFWEKATILHAEYHRPADKATPPRYARHYSDMASLWNHASRRTSLEQSDLLERVAVFKERYFHNPWAQYETARLGTLRLCPPESRLADLRRDYRAMEPMFLDKPPEFEQVLGTLKDAERELNGRG
jgi:hypothetical protein